MAFSVLATLFCLPLIARYGQSGIYDYLVADFPHGFALTLSWIAVIILAVCVFFGLSAFVQFTVQLLFRRGSSARGPF